MKDARKKAVLTDCLKRFRLPAALFLLNAALAYVIFRLYGVRTEPFWYALAVTACCLAAVFFVRLTREGRRAAERQRAEDSVLSDWIGLPVPENLAEEDYTRMVERLGAEKERLSEALLSGQKNTRDFYTAWVHQIKTPIAVMKLALGSPAEIDRAALQEELFRIEQYTGMVLAYQRLESSSNDLVIGEYSLDEMIREVIRTYAPQFISKKVKLVYEGTGLRIVTDRKWFLLMLEQLVSNALKYTPAGTITVSTEGGILAVTDTGIGIAPEDLPRIFEKGYTGVNGRLNDKSSGLGLYLCGEAAKLLNLPVRAESTPGEGSRFSIDLREKIAEDRARTEN